MSEDGLEVLKRWKSGAWIYHGGDSDPNGENCIMNYIDAAMKLRMTGDIGQTLTDTPPCTASYIAGACIVINDSVSDKERQRLWEFFNRIYSAHPAASEEVQDRIRFKMAIWCLKYAMDFTEDEQALHLARQAVLLCEQALDGEDVRGAARTLIDHAAKIQREAWNHLPIADPDEIIKSAITSSLILTVQGVAYVITDDADAFGSHVVRLLTTADSDLFLFLDELLTQYDKERADEGVLHENFWAEFQQASGG